MIGCSYSGENLYVELYYTYKGLFYGVYITLYTYITLYNGTQLKLTIICPLSIITNV